jgi:hypothetical protein
MGCYPGPLWLTQEWKNRQLLQERRREDTLAKFMGKISDIISKTNNRPGSDRQHRGLWGQAEFPGLALDQSVCPGFLLDELCKTVTALCRASFPQRISALFQVSLSVALWGDPPCLTFDPYEIVWIESTLLLSFVLHAWVFFVFFFFSFFKLIYQLCFSLSQGERNSLPENTSFPSMEQGRGHSE